MFCTNCGMQIDDAANFCRTCGAQVKHADAPAAAALPSAPPLPPPAPVHARPAAVPPAPAGRQTTCPWCAAVIDAAELSCPRCGATLNAPPQVSETGWKQLPGRKDMAKLQFGDSFCQIEGLYVPVADVKLVAFRQHLFHASCPAVERSASEHDHHVVERRLEAHVGRYCRW